MFGHISDGYILPYKNKFSYSVGIHLLLNNSEMSTPIIKCNIAYFLGSLKNKEYINIFNFLKYFQNMRE